MYSVYYGLLLLLSLAQIALALRLVVFQRPSIHRLDPSASYTFDANLLVSNWAPFKEFPTHLQQTLNETASLNLTLAFNKDAITTAPLLHPGHARVILITPSEFVQLAKVGLTMDEINRIAMDSYISYAPIRATCYGLYQEDGEEVVFLRVWSRVWLNIREKVLDVFLEKGGEPDQFKVDKFYPHITVGETRLDYVKDDLVASEPGCFAEAIPGEQLIL